MWPAHKNDVREDGRRMRNQGREVHYQRSVAEKVLVLAVRWQKLLRVLVVIVVIVVCWQKVLLREVPVLVGRDLTQVEVIRLLVFLFNSNL